MHADINNETVDIAPFDNGIMKQPAGIVLTSFSARKTSLVPIHRLPTEILTTIFILCVREVYYSGESPGSPTQSPPSWVNISYVCARWRNAAINCTALWSDYLFMVSRRWTEELLARSKQASLTIVADLRSTKAPLRVFEPVADHVERIEKLCLHLPHPLSSSDYQLLSNLISTPAPRLQSLELSQFRIPVVTSLRPFKGSTSALRTLKLTSCSMYWYLLPLSGLTTLVLRDIPSHFRSDVAALPILGHMPRLVHLDVEVANNFSIEAHAITHNLKVTLSCLTRVVIRATLPTIVTFLSCVDIPLKAQLTLLENFDEDPTLAESNQLFHLLSQRFSQPGDRALAVPIIRSLDICLDSDSTKLVFSASEHISHDPKEQDSRCLLKVAVIPEPLSMDQAIRHICRVIPPTDLQRLLFTYPPESSDLWKSILECFPNLQHIRLEGGFIPDDFATLFCSTPHADGQDGHTGQGHNQKLVPLLEELELHDIEFSAREDVDDCLIGLQDALSTRTQPRCRFTMTQCRLYVYYYTMFNSVGWWEGDTFEVTTDLGNDDSDDDEFELS